MNAYGTFLYPRLEKSGNWVLQTDWPELIGLMQLRNWDVRSPWRQCLSGTSYGFTRSFICSRDAKNSVTRILSRIAPEFFEFIELDDDKGWEIKTSPSPQDIPQTCLDTGKYSEPQIKLEGELVQ